MQANEREANDKHQQKAWALDLAFDTIKFCKSKEDWGFIADSYQAYVKDDDERVSFIRAHALKRALRMLADRDGEYDSSVVEAAADTLFDYLWVEIEPVVEAEQEAAA